MSNKCFRQQNTTSVQLIDWLMWGKSTKKLIKCRFLATYACLFVAVKRFAEFHLNYSRFLHRCEQIINWFPSKLKLIPWSRSFWLDWLKQTHAIFKGVIYICQLQVSQYSFCLASFLKNCTHLESNMSTNPRAEKTKVLVILSIFRSLDNQLSSMERI